MDFQVSDIILRPDVSRAKDLAYSGIAERRQRSRRTPRNLVLKTMPQGVLPGIYVVARMPCSSQTTNAFNAPSIACLLCFRQQLLRSG
jgi:hypothetical protein